MDDDDDNDDDDAMMITNHLIKNSSKLYQVCFAVHFLSLHIELHL